MSRLARPVLFLALACAAAFGCATPAPVVRMHPIDPTPTAWAAGEAVVAREAEGVRVATAFSGQRDGMVALRVEIRNGTDAPVTVDPAYFTHAICPDEKTAVQGMCSRRVYVHDPERLLLNLDLARERAIADKQTEEGVGTFLVLLNVVGGVAAVAAGDGDAASTFVDNAADTAITHGHLAETHERRAQAFAGTRHNLEATLLRKSTIPPGEAVAGLVFLPIYEEARALRVTFGVGHLRFRFAFRQTMHTEEDMP